MRTTRHKSTLLHFAQGLLMGGADIIPGVSGGTMALIIGIYSRLIDSLSSLFSMVFGVIRMDRSLIRRHAAEVEWPLVIPLLLGIVIAIMVASLFMPHLLDTYPQQMRGLFVGLVAASIAVPWLRIGRLTPQLLLIAILAAAAAFLVVGLPLLVPDQAPSPMRIFASASVAICAMILPGVSGAFLLEVLGIYRATTEALRSAMGFEWDALLYVLTFVAGAAVGLGVFSKALNWLLYNYHARTMAALVGLMAGSLRALWPWQNWEAQERTLLWPGPGDAVTSVILLGAGGLVFVATLTWLGARRIKASADAEPSEDQARL